MPHKNIFKMVSLANKKNISTTISSNLNVFPEKYEYELVNSNLERLVVSFDGTTQETYSAYRVGGKIERVIENVKRIVAAKKALRKKTPFIKLQFLVNRFNEHQIGDVKAFAGNNEVEIEIKPLIFNGKDQEESNKWKPRTVELERTYNFSHADDNRGNYWCNWLWKYIVINWDGTVTPCCNWIENGLFEFGDFKKHTLDEIWNNEYYVSARTAIKTGRSELVTACNYCLGNPPAVGENK